MFEDILNELFASFSEESLQSTNSLVQLRQDLPLIRGFCIGYHTRLLAMGRTCESDHPENVYLFTDNSGWYTREGLQASIAEVVRDN